ANITGLTYVSNRLAAKRLELLNQIAPEVSRVALLTPPLSPDDVSEAEAAAQLLEVEFLSLVVQDPPEVERALQTAATWRAQALMTSAGPLLFAQRTQIVEFATRIRLPSIHYRREFVEAGGL